MSTVAPYTITVHLNQDDKTTVKPADLRDAHQTFFGPISAAFRLKKLMRCVQENNAILLTQATQNPMTEDEFRAVFEEVYCVGAELDKIINERCYAFKIIASLAYWILNAAGSFSGDLQKLQSFFETQNVRVMKCDDEDDSLIKEQFVEVKMLRRPPISSTTIISQYQCYITEQLNQRGYSNALLESSGLKGFVETSDINLAIATKVEISNALSPYVQQENPLHKDFIGICLYIKTQIQQERWLS